jgi:hypothetical protein
MENCKAPNCVFNEKKNKCVKPNPYVQWLSKCRKTLNSIKKCKSLYNISIEKHKKKACDYYLENKKNIKTTCPKNRIPIKDKCPNDYPIKKLNKNNDECCYKERKQIEKKVIKKIPIIKKESVDKFKDINIKPEKLINGKLPKLVNKYQHKPRVNKIPK